MIKSMNLLAIIFLAFTFGGCSGDDDDDVSAVQEPTPITTPPATITITADPSSVQALAEGGTYEVKVSTTGESWSARTNDKWLSVELSGETTSEGTISITVEENTGVKRMGIVNITSDKKTISLGVEQNAGLRVESEVFMGSNQSELKIKVEGDNTDIKVESNQEWLSVSYSNSYVILSAEQNEEFVTREATVKVSDGKQTRNIHVVQDSTSDPATDIKCPLNDYSLVWQDEFEGNGISDDWTYEVQNSGWVNNELQNYIKGHKDGKYTIETKDGKLNINCFKTSDGKIYSGRIKAKESIGWQYGYMEARIKLPKGKGTWPAFWMMPCNVDWANEGWPKCGEIDIMEEVGCVPNEVSSSLHAEGHVHTNNTQVTHAMTIENAEGEYHIYAIEWTKEYIRTYVDGQEQLYYASDGTIRNYPYDKPYYIILNLAWGGSWGGYKGIDESALPTTMQVDYVRVFQKK